MATLDHILPELTLGNFPTSSCVEISILLTNDNRIQGLNRDFRSKDKSTNVLSFPDTELTGKNLKQAVSYGEPLTLGDIVFAEETIYREASEQNKPMENHLAHLAVHGILHLLGYDHMNDEDANHMEALEIQILEKMYINNPYQLDNISDGTVLDKK